MKFVENNTSRVEYDYTNIDGRDVVTQEKSYNQNFDVHAVDFILNSDGLLNSISTNNGNISFSYNNDSKIIGQNDLSGKNFNYSYHSSGSLKQIKRGLLTSNFSYNSNNQIELIENKFNSSLVTFNSYAYGNTGFISTETTNSGFKNFSYDNRGQVLDSHSTSYDSLGNMTRNSSNSFYYDYSKNRLIRDNKYLYFHDQVGKLTSKQEIGMTGNFINYNYNSLDQLVSFEKFENNIKKMEVIFKYDAIGRRIQKTVNSDNSYIEKYNYIGKDISAVLNENNEVMATFTHSVIRGTDVLAIDVTSKGVGKISQNSGSYYYLKDAVSSIRSILDSSGNIVQTYEYSTFGEINDIKDNSGNSIISNPKVKTMFSFANMWYEKELNHYQTRSRVYDPRLGRFLQQDSDPGVVSSPLTSVNKYIYSLNNPVNFRDPSGASIVDDLLGGFLNMVGLDFWSLMDLGVTAAHASKRIFSSEGLKVALIVVASFYTGGLAGAAVGGGLLGALVGGVVGGVVGGAVGGIFNQLSGDNFQDGFEQGFKIGFTVGAISGKTEGLGLFKSGAQASNASSFGANLAMKPLEGLCAVGVALVLGYFFIKYAVIPAAQKSWDLGPLEEILKTKEKPAMNYTPANQTSSGGQCVA